MRLPIGIQDFTNLREEDYLYVDKTMYMMPFLEGGRFFFARPRRFGKSMLVSTLRAAFSGRKDLFHGLWLEDRFDFKPRPVIRIDFSNISFRDQPLQKGIMEWLEIIASEYGLELQGDTIPSAFRNLILELSKTTKVVVLIDEYDKPITDYINQLDKRLEHQGILKSLYGVLKPLDAHLHTVFLTGVSKIGKLSLFSDLNNLQDISLNAKYAQLCGYTKSEIEKTFPDYLNAVAENLELEMPELQKEIAHWYNGYSWDGINRVYCPFSFLIFLEQKVFKSFWYETGTPTFLVDLIRASKINPLEFEATEIADSEIRSTNVERINPTSLMFQTGYLTILSMSKGAFGVAYTLGYPNQEVRQAFSSDLIHEYSQLTDSFHLKLYRNLEKLDWDGFFAVVNQVLSSIPYEIFRREEAYPHSLLHIMLLATGFRVQSQVQTSLGRMDILLETYTHWMIFEIKIGGTAQQALNQAKNNQYASGLTGKPVVLIGVVFDLEAKQFSSWLVE